jgi:branched-chain amino acid transport system ATP-binding protein
MRETAPLLLCRGVSKYFGAMAAVDSVDLALQPGEVLGIGGPNGAGKTTLFDVISGLTRADAGSINFEGTEIQGLSPWNICHLGIARTFQLNAGFDTLTARENVLVAGYFGLRNRLFPSMSWDSKMVHRVEEALAFVGMSDKVDHEVRNLSVLERKRLMVAAAIVTEPRLILMDEPVGGLNPEEIDEMLEIVKKLQAAGTTLIIIEHVMRFLVQLTTRLVILHHGQMIYEGSSENLTKDKTVVEVYLGEGTSNWLDERFAS